MKSPLFCGRASRQFVLAGRRLRDYQATHSDNKRVEFNESIIYWNKHVNKINQLFRCIEKKLWAASRVRQKILISAAGLAVRNDAQRPVLAVLFEKFTNCCIHSFTIDNIVLNNN